MWQEDLNLSELPDATTYHRSYCISTDLLTLIILLQTFKLLQRGGPPRETPQNISHLRPSTSIYSSFAHNCRWYLKLALYQIVNQLKQLGDFLPWNFKRKYLY